jgi:ABC-type transporter Mla subunit MlaD
VTAYLEHEVRPRVLLLETALATVNQQVRTYCRAVDLREVSSCFGQSLDLQTLRARALRQAFAQQAGVLASLSAWPSSLPLLSSSTPEVAQQLDRLTEDLAACSGQLAALLADHGQLMAALATLPPSGSLALGPSVTLSRLDYLAQVHSALQLLHRAEGWLETVDQETGARVTFPGVEPGAPSLESQLALQ